MRGHPALIAISLFVGACGDPVDPGTGPLDPLVGEWRYQEWRFLDESGAGSNILLAGSAGTLTILSDGRFHLEEFHNTNPRTRTMLDGRVEVDGDILRLPADVDLRRYRLEDGPDAGSIRLVRQERVPNPRFGEEGQLFEETIVLGRVPDFGSREGRIIFVREREAVDDLDDGTDLWVIPAAGGIAVRLTNDPATEAGPVWSPDGTRVAFVSDRSGANGVYVMQSDGSNVVRIDPDVPGESPTWSPTGDRIALVRADGVYLADAGGAPNPVRLGPPDGLDQVWMDPAWSPLGGSLLVIDRKPGTSWSFIFEAEEDGSLVNLVTEAAGEYGEPAALYWDVDWSPNGDFLLFMADGGFNHAIFRQRLPDGVPAQITEDGRGASSPSVSPSGHAFTFESFGDIYIGTPDGHFINLTSGLEGTARAPDWGP